MGISKQTNTFNVTGAIASLFFLSNKKGMIGNLIGGFIVILIGVSLMGPIAQEMSNIVNCNSTLLNISTGDPQGSTDSFGGGGSNHFGGYDNTIAHKTFLQSVADTSLIKSDKSILNPDCEVLTGASATVLQIVPLFFALGVMGAAIAMIYGSLRSGGLIGGLGTDL